MIHSQDGNIVIQDVELLETATSPASVATPSSVISESEGGGKKKKKEKFVKMLMIKSSESTESGHAAAEDHHHHHNNDKNNQQHDHNQHEAAESPVSIEKLQKSKTFESTELDDATCEHLVHEYEEYKDKKTKLYRSHAKIGMLIHSPRLRAFIQFVNRSLFLLEMPFERVPKAKRTPYMNLRRKLAAILEGKIVHTIIILLTVLDMAIVATEILMDLYLVEENEHVENTHLAFHIMTLIILSVFIVEIFFKLFAFGIQFIKNIIFVLDAVIVIASFVLDNVFYNAVGDLVGLLVMIRVWRIVRIVYGAAYSITLDREEKIHVMKEKQEFQKKMYENSIQILIDRILELDRENRKLKFTLREFDSGDSGD